MSIPLLIAIAGGILVAGAAAFFLLRELPVKQQTLVRVPVPAHDISAYATVNAEDLEWRAIEAVPPGVIADPGQVVGKVAAVPLYKGELIIPQRLMDVQRLDASRRIVAVNVDLVRSGGGAIKPGDIVDVYWLANADTPGALFASDARVVALNDAQGAAAGQARTTIPGQPAQQTLPALAVLAVKAEEAPQVARGALEKSNNVVLVKKLADGGTPPAAEGAAASGAVQ